jgi:phage shock protein A
MLNTIANHECANFAEKMPDPIKTLSHIIFNMSLDHQNASSSSLLLIIN